TPQEPVDLPLPHLQVEVVNGPLRAVKLGRPCVSRTTALLTPMASAHLPSDKESTRGAAESPDR
ncbi:MAG: hypothetical protein AB1700_11795, partial [Bacillota bacterium]